MTDNRIIQIYTEHDTINKLFNLEVNSNLRFNFNITYMENGVTHNLPNKFYKNFVGRNNELLKLTELIDHERNYITTLDGIGGVGKTSLALEYCYNLTKKNIDNYKNIEFVIWVTSKNTLFKNGQVKELKQPLEYLEQLLDFILTVINNKSL